MRISFTITAQPDQEPVTLGELRAQTRIDDGADDALLMGYLIGARQAAETFMGRPILPTAVAASFEAWPDDGKLVLDAPIISVTEVAYTGADGEPAVWSDYILRSAPGGVKTLRPAAGASWPTLGEDPVISITAVAGWPVALLPQDVCTGILQIAGHWYNVRESVNVGNIVTDVPDAGKALLRPYRWRLIG